MAEDGPVLLEFLWLFFSGKKVETYSRKYFHTFLALFQATNLPQ